MTAAPNREERVTGSFLLRRHILRQSRHDPFCLTAGSSLL